MSQRSCLAFVKFPCLCCLVVLGSLYLNFVPKYCFSCPCGVSYMWNVSSQISTRSLLLSVLRKTSFVVFWFWCLCYETLTCLRGMLHLPQSSPAHQLESFVEVKVKRCLPLCSYIAITWYSSRSSYWIILAAASPSFWATGATRSPSLLASLPSRSSK